MLTYFLLWLAGSVCAGLTTALAVLVRERRRATGARRAVRPSGERAPG